MLNSEEVAQGPDIRRLWFWALAGFVLVLPVLVVMPLTAFLLFVPVGTMGVVLWAVPRTRGAGYRCLAVAVGLLLAAAGYLVLALSYR